MEIFGNVHVEGHRTDRTRIDPLTQLIQDIILNATSANPDLQLKAVTTIRSLLDQHPTYIDHVINSGLVSYLVNSLKNNLLRKSAALALTVISSGTTAQGLTIVAAGGVPIFVQMLASPDHDIKPARALGNLISATEELRNYVISLGVIPPLLNLLQPKTSLNTRRNVAWLILNLCKYPPFPQGMRDILPALVRIVWNHNKFEEDLQLLPEILHALIYWTDAGEYGIQSIINTGILPSLISLMSSPLKEVKFNATQVVGLLISGINEQSPAILELNIGILCKIGKLTDIVKHEDKTTSIYDLVFLSHVFSSIDAIVQAVIDSKLMPLIIDVLLKEEVTTVLECKVADLTPNCQINQARRLVIYGVIRKIGHFLCKKNLDFNIVEPCLNAIIAILKSPTFEDQTEVINMIKKHKLWTAILSQCKRDTSISTKRASTIAKLISDNKTHEDLDLVPISQPTIGKDGTFIFNTSFGDMIWGRDFRF